MLTHYNIIFNFNGIDIFIFLLKNYIKVEAFWLPLQSVFAKDTAFLSAKAQNLGIRLAPNSRDNMPVLALELGTLFPNSAQAEFGALAWGFW